MKKDLLRTILFEKQYEILIKRFKIKTLKILKLL